MAASHSWELRFYRFLRVKPLCNIFFKIRYIWFVLILRRLKSFENLDHVDGHQHNSKGILHARPSDRILKLIMPLSIIDSLNVDSKILAIGCRYETDLLYLASHGFSVSNIRGLDLLSYSPWIDLGNMHNMSYEDNTWDAVMMGWVLTYSKDPKKAAAEIIRVTRPKGIVAIGITTYPEKYIAEQVEEGMLPVEYETLNRINSTSDILMLFGNHVDKIYFQHDRSNEEKQGPCLIVFSLN